MSLAVPAKRRIYRIPDLTKWLQANADKRAADPEEFDLHLAAIEWSLASALDINRREDFRSIPTLNVSPFEHQVDNAIQFFRCLNPRGMIADDVGLGKTISAGLIARELLDRQKIESILVVCPKSLMEQWEEELDSKFEIRAISAVGGDFRQLDGARFWITSYHTARNNISAIEARNFDLIIFDEAHAFRNLYGAPRPPKTAVLFQKALKNSKVRFCIMLTATPIQNRLWDIYSQFDVLCVPQPNPLGPPDEFENRFIQDREARQLRPGTAPEFRRRIGQALVRTRRRDSKLLFPDREVRDSRLKPLPGEREYIDEALKVILEFERLVQYSYSLSLMSSPWALAASFEKKLKEPLPQPLRQKIERLVTAGRAMGESAKTRAVVEFVKATAKQGRADRIIIFTMRLETLRFLKNSLECAGFSDQIALIHGRQGADNRRAVQDFMAEPPLRPILLSTDTGAVGLNLQNGNIIVNYDLPWNPMTIEQRIGRVQRIGQKAKHVIVHNLVLAGTVEDQVVLRLMEKLSLFNQAIGEMDELLELCGYDEENRSLEQVIMDLIRKAAEYKDINEDLARMDQSRRAAEAKMKEIRDATEQALGSIRAADSGARLSNLRKTTPRMDLRGLIVGCLRRADSVLRETRDGRVFAKTTTGEVEFVFDQADTLRTAGLVGHEPRLVIPGTRAFDRITQRVREGACTFLMDGRGQDLKKVMATLRERLQRMGMVVERLEAVGHQQSSALWFGLRATASVANDRYETLVEFPIAHQGDGVERFADPAALSHLTEDMGLSPAPADVLRSVRVQVNEDELKTMLQGDDAVQAFCTFYETRFAEDLKRLAEFVKERHGLAELTAEMRVETAARQDPAVRTAMQSLQRFAPQIVVTPAGVCGIVYDRVAVDAHVRNHRQREAYPVRLQTVPLSGAVTSEFPLAGTDRAPSNGWACPGGHIVAAADFERCDHPDCTMGACSACLAKRRLQVRFTVCTYCDRQLCQDHRFTCVACKSPLCWNHAYQLSGSHARACEGCSTTLPDGRRLLTSDVAVSVVTGKVGAKGELAASVLSGRPAFPDELVQCDESGRLILPDEIERCTVTGKRVARDMVAKSDVSGRHALHSKLVASAWSGRKCIIGEEVRCEETGSVLLPDEVGTCSVTDRSVCKNLLETDAVSGDSVLMRLMVRSSVSGRYSRHMVISAVSGRMGLASEAGLCEVCGSQVLQDELHTCPETGRRATREHFELCDVDRVLVLPEGLSRCEVTGKRVRRSLLAMCLETGKTALHDLFETCGETGSRTLPEGLAASSLSGERVRKSLLTFCEETGELALPREFAVCSVTQRRVRPELLVRCPDTGLGFLSSAGARCEETGMMVHPAALGECSATSRWARLTELTTDDLTGRPILKRLAGVCEEFGTRTVAVNLLSSTVSGKRVLAELLRPCEESGQLALPGELDRCALTGRSVHPNLLFTCPETGEKLLRRLAERCEVSGKWVCPTGAAACEVTGKRVRRSLLAIDEVSGASVHAKLLRACERTGRRTVEQHLARSQVSGTLALRDLMVPCQASGALALFDELSRCAHTGKLVLPRLLAPCGVSEEMVLAELLRSCEVSGRRVLPSHLSKCRRTGKTAVTELFSRSELSGESGLAAILHTCQTTGRKVFPDELVTLSDGRRVAQDRLYTCPGCGHSADIGELFRCAVCQQEYCKEDGQGTVCAHCRVLLSERRGEPMPPGPFALVKNHASWARTAMLLMTSGLLLVEGRAFSLWPGGKVVLLVFERRGDGIGPSLRQEPIVRVPVNRELVRAMKTQL
jgi:superfamily II DNA or RNA helicase